MSLTDIICEIQYVLDINQMENILAVWKIHEQIHSFNDNYLEFTGSEPFGAISQYRFNVLFNITDNLHLPVLDKLEPID